MEKRVNIYKDVDEPDWKYCQENSDIILSDGIFILLSSETIKWSEIEIQKPGNYIISHNEKPYYIGEADNLAKRIKQQFNPKTSSFFKKYIKVTKNDADKILEINDFSVQVIETNIGRKELEEFGIANLPGLLNSFQIDKRSKVEIKSHNGIWKIIQKRYKKIFDEAEKDVISLPSKSWLDSDVPPSPGIYLVNDEKGALIYVGESSDILKRFQTHSTRTYFSALRRHIGTEILGFELKTIKGKKRYFSDNENVKVNKFLKLCNLRFKAIKFGRYELEKYLIRKYRPFLNRKDKT